MTTARERMKALSGLSGSHSARAHFLAITQGTGTGQTIFASMFSVQIEEPRLFAVQRQRYGIHEGSRPAASRLSESAPKAVSIFTGEASLMVKRQTPELFVRQESAKSIAVRDLGKERFTVRQSDVFEVHQGE